MGFFNSLQQIAVNNKNFKRWEDEQEQRQAQREALYERRTYTDQEIDKAKALGRNIIDAVDVMDNHSESVAENVETAVQPIVGIVPVVATLGTAFVAGKYVVFPNTEKIYRIEDEIRESISAKELAKKISREKGLENFTTHDLTKKKKIEAIKDSSLRSQAEAIFEKYTQKTAGYKRNVKIAALSPIAAMIASFIGATIYAAKLQVDSSKIARFQARKFLDDPRTFVNYTPEQIEDAKAQIAAHPEWAKMKEKEKEQLKTGMFKSIVNLFKDRAEYKLVKSLDRDESKLVTRELTEEELKQAERDKEVIQRTVKIINNEAEKYSENMEVAAGVIIGGTPLLGAAVGGVLGLILDKAGVIDKYVDNHVNKNGSEKTKKIYNEFKELAKIKKPTALEKMNYHAKWNEFSSSLSEDAGKVVNGVRRSPSFKDELKSIVVSGFAHKWGKKGIISAVGGFITGIAGAILGLKLQKASARAGRYTAKRELEKDPRNFIGYTQEDFDEVKDVQNTKKKESKFKEYALFIPNVLKQFWKYENYRKNEYKQNQLLRDVLMYQTEASDEQLKDAKNLQRKIFNTFEKVDDNSQQYSEAMEAATEIAQPFVMYGGIFAMISPLIYIAAQVKKGKISSATVLNKVTGILSKSSNIMKTKLFKKYLKEVEENIPVQIQKAKINKKAYRTESNNNLKVSIAEKIEELKNIKDPKSILTQFKSGIEKLSDEEVKEFMADKMPSMDKKTILEIIPKLEKMVDNIPKAEVSKIKETLIREFNEHPDEFVELVQSGNIAKTLMTPIVKKAALAAGISWTALTVVVTYAIESWLADMQLKAGRLGVMKSLESLQDNRYYANVEPEIA